MFELATLIRKAFAHKVLPVTIHPNGEKNVIKHDVQSFAQKPN